MSYSPAQMFPGAFAPDAAFIDGKFKDSSAPGVYDGSPLSTILFNQEQAFWDAVMLAGGEEYNNSADTPATSQLFKALQQSRQVEPINNSWNGFFDPKHQEQLPSPAGYPATSGAGGTVYGADDEWSLGNYSSGAANTISADDDGVIFSVGTYKLFTFTSEQLANIDVDKVPVYVVDETGGQHFLTNATNGVNVTKPDATTLKVELTADVFAELGITKVWEFFVTDGVGYVPKLGPDETERRVRGGFVLVENANGSAKIYSDGYKRQSGRIGSGSGDRIVTLPVPFDNTNYIKNAVDAGTSGAAVNACKVSDNTASTTSTFTVYRASVTGVSSGPIEWFAEGY